MAQRECLVIPSGVRSVALSTTADTLIRVIPCTGCSCTTPCPATPCGPACAATGFPWEGKRSLWDLQQHDIDRMLHAPDRALPAAALMRIARDNHFRAGGLSSVALARAELAKSSRQPRVASMFRRLKGLHTGYRQLYPSQGNTIKDQFFAWFFARLPRRFDLSPSQHVLSATHVDETLDKVNSGGIFWALPTSPHEALRFAVPEEPAPSTLRLTIDKRFLDSPVRLWVQLDESTPVELRATTGVDLVDRFYEPTASEISLAALRQIHPESDIGTLGGPFSRGRTPSLYFRAGFTTLLVPRRTRTVRVWGDNSDAYVTAHFRRSNPFELSEQAYLELARREGVSHGGFWGLLTGPRIETGSFALRELQNHWRPLMRFLRSRQRLIQSSVDKNGFEFDSPIEPAKASEIIGRAQQAEARGQWLSALEAWVELREAHAPELRRESVLGQLRVLAELGERWPLETTARGVMLFDPDPGVREVVYEFLRRYYRSADDTEAWEAIAVTRALQSATPKHLRDLAEALVANQRFTHALMVATAMAEDERPRELMARCAYQLKWWLLFQLSVDSISDPQQQDFWTGLWHMQAGRPAAAIRRLERAGRTGQAFADHYRRGRAMLRKIRSHDAATRAAAILQWEKWCQDHPGGLVWKEDKTLVASTSGSSLLRATGQDLTSAYHHASPGRPIRLRVQGPARLRFDVRPRHDATSPKPVSDWLNVRSSTQHFVFPLSSPQPSGELRIVGSPDLPGLATTASVEMGAGYHELLVDSNAIDVLVRVLVERPELQLPILPPINAVTMEAAIAGRWRTYQDTAFGFSPALMTLVRDSQVAKPGLVYATPHLLWNPDKVLQAISGLPMRARTSLRLARGDLADAEMLTALALQGPELDWHERLLALDRAGTLPDLEQVLLQSDSGLPAPIRDAYLTATERVLDAIDWNASEEVAESTEGPTWGDEDPSRSLLSGATRTAMLMAYAADSGAAPQVSMLLRGRALTLTQLRKLPWKESDRFSSQLRWVRIAHVDKSAGIFADRLRVWTPESPLLRVRRAMLRGIQPGDHVLFGPYALSMTSATTKPSRLQIDMEVVPGGFVPAAVATIEVEVEGAPPQRFEVRPGRSKRIPIQLASGRNTVRFRLPSPLNGQFVRLALNDDSSQESAQQNLKLRMDRSYHVATPDEPVEINVAGPKLLRIDETVDGTTASRFQLVERGSHTISLPPSHAANRSLYRVFEAIHDPSRSSDHYATVVDAAEPPLPSLVGTIDLPWDSGMGEIQLSSLQPADELNGLPLFPADAPSVVLAGRDQQRLGGQEDGTWEFSSGFNHRRSLEESPNDVGVDDFGQFMWTHRLFDEHWDIYFRNSALLRVRADSGPTFGLQHVGNHRLPESGWDLQWSVSAYTQEPSPMNSLLDQDQEWLIDGRVRLYQKSRLRDNWFHAPSITVFGRETSLRENFYGPGRVDQNIFTDYKFNHPAGVMLADRFTWEACLDERWWVRPFVTSNEDFNVAQPDFYGFQIGYQRIVGGLDWDLSYRLAEFIEDENRIRDRTQQLLFADVHLHHWTVAGRRIELSGRMRHNLGDGRTSGNVFVSFFLDHGRHYRDFHPGELRFIHHRRRNAELHVANLLTDR